MGTIVAHRMQKMGVTQRHERLRTVRREYEYARDEFLEWAEDKDELVMHIESYLDWWSLKDVIEPPISSFSVSDLGQLPDGELSLDDMPPPPTDEPTPQQSDHPEGWDSIPPDVTNEDEDQDDEIGVSETWGDEEENDEED